VGQSHGPLFIVLNGAVLVVGATIVCDCKACQLDPRPACSLCVCACVCVCVCVCVHALRECDLHCLLLQSCGVKYNIMVFKLLFYCLLLHFIFIEWELLTGHIQM